MSNAWEYSNALNVEELTSYMNLIIHIIGAVDDWSMSEAARYSNSAPTNFAMFRKRGEISARRNGRAKTGSDLPPPDAISVAS
ncbi:hypothetical protein M422DRAFT_272792 [Sphaerobolus stellatus SS14]|uniref:Unplaced genomic scaffold SPHSTscaffold_306, whole genome shotgun sequence n=1 Tax=Sphaerobolus stellatus (strain SS14) TaxID=990650 RepID=A0A0C9UKZ7_SPHS4|nr:hypothetical protein M422DRAFT_272792 [Sphaerobolus stellatus SS14]